MKKVANKLFVLWIIVFCLALVSCGLEKKEPLPSPQDVRTEGKLLLWEEVENATGYVVRIGEEEQETAEPSYNLAALRGPATYAVAVKAVGGEAYADSEWVGISYEAPTTIEIGYDETGLVFYLMEDGTGYELSLNVHITEFIKGKTEIVLPDFFNDLPVKRIAKLAFQLGGEYGGATPSQINRQIKRIQLPSKLEEIGIGAFLNQMGLEEIVIPDSVTKIETMAFQGCQNLKKVTLPKNLKLIPDCCFQHCALSELSLPEGLETIEMYAFSPRIKTYYPHTGITKYEYTNQTFTEVVFPASIKEIAASAFLGCQSLQSIVLPENLENLELGKAFNDTAWYNAQSDGLVYLGDVLYGYKGDMPENTALEIPEGTKYITHYAFSGDDNLISITFPQGVKFLGGKTLYFCKALSEVILPSDLKKIPDEMFSGCDGLVEIELPSGVTEIGESAFGLCDNLKTVELPASLKKIGSSAFKKCVALEEIKLPAGLEEIGGNAFQACTALKTVEMPASLKRIGGAAFSGCSSLEEIVLPAGLEEIRGYAFENCDNLQEVVLPQSLKLIGLYLFKDCDALAYVYYEGTDSQWEKILEESEIESPSEDMFGGAEFYIYSKGAPTKQGNYWHYVNGEISHWL